MIEHPDTDLFDIEAARKQAKQQSLAKGRGHAVFFDYHGKAMVIKHYQRGGKMALLLDDKYIGSSCSRSRSFREWRLLRQMRAMDLPVPEAVAASCVRYGLYHRADLVTRQIENVVTLADHLLDATFDHAGWYAIGACIRRFHDASVYHADLNARNILLDVKSDTVYLIDFDKGGIRHLGDAWKAANLARLQRSLQKFNSLNAVFHFNQGDWNVLLEGYKSS